MKLEFLAALLELLKKYGPVAADLKPIIQNLISDIRAESGMSSSEIIAGTKVELDSLDEDLLRDLEPAPRLHENINSQN